MPGKAPFSKRFEDVMGEALRECAGAAPGAQFGLSTSTVLAIDHGEMAA